MTRKTKKLVTLLGGLVLVGLIVLGATVGWNAWKGRQQRVIATQAALAMGRGNYVRAETLYTELLAYMPNSYGVMLGISEACVHQGKFDQAREWADKASAIAPKEALPRFQKASVDRHEAAHVLKEAPDPLSPASFDRVEGLCGQATDLLKEVSRTIGADPRFNTEMGQLATVRADAALRRAEAAQDQADQAHAAGQADQERTAQKLADQWRLKSSAFRQEGAKQLSTAVQLAPKDMRLVEIYAEACVNAARWSDAIVAYRKATTVGRPTPETALTAAGATRAAMADKGPAARAQGGRLAKEVLTQAIKNHPFNADLKVELASVELGAGALDAAEKLLDEAKTLTSPSPWARVLRAKLLLARGKPAEARRSLEALDADAPNLSEVKMALFEAEQRCGHPDRATALLRQVLALEPTRTEARLALARGIAGQGHWEAASAVLAAGFRRDPSDLPLLRAAAEAAVRSCRTAALEALVKRTEQVCEGMPAVPGNLAIFCLRLGRPDWAARVVETSFKSDPKLAITQLTSAMAEVAEGKPDAAIKLLRPRGDRSDEPIEVHLSLAEAYSVKGRLYQADSQLQKALVAAENDYLTTLRAIDLYADMGMMADARSRSRRLLDEDPEAPASLWQGVRLALLDGDLPRATGLLTTLGSVGQQPKTPLERSIVHLLGGRGAEAVAALKGQDSAMAHLVSYWALKDTDRSDQAVAALEAAIKAKPKQTSLYLRMADHFADLNKPKAGLGRLEALAPLSPANVALAVGRMHLLTGKPDVALETYQTFLAKNATKLDKESDGQIRLAMAACHHREGDSAKEMTIYREMQRDSAIGLKGLEAAVLLLVRLGQVDQVKQMLDQISSLTTQRKLSPDWLARMATAYERIGEVAKAADIYDQIARQLPEALWVWRAKAELYLRAGQAGQAIELYRHALRQQPGNRGLLRDLARAQVRIGRFPEAFETLARIAPPEHNAVVVARDKALLMGSLGLAAARPRLEAIASHPLTVDPEAMFALARRLLDQGDTKGALERLGGIPATSREYTLARVLMARQEQDRGRTKQALAILTEAMGEAGDPEPLAWARYGLLLNLGRIEEATEFARGRASASTATSTRWAVSGGDLDVLRRVHERQPTNWGLAIRLGAFLLAKKDWKRTQEVLTVDRPTTTTATASTQRARSAGPAAECLRALAEVADGKVKEGRQRLDALLKREGLAREWTAAAAIAWLSSGPPEKVEPLRKALGRGIRRDLFEAMLERSKTPAGQAACRWVAASRIAQRLRLAVLSYRLSDMAVKADEGSVGARFAQLAALRAMGAGESEPARKLSDEMVKRFKGSPLAREVAVRGMLARGELSQAVAATKAWDQTGGVPADLASDIGTLAMEKGDPAEALQWFERCLKQDPDHAVAANNAACLIAELQDKDAKAMDRALSLAERSLELGGQRPSFTETLGWILVKRGRAGDGLGMLQRAIVSLAGNPRVHYHIGLAYAATGSVEMARLHLEQFVGASKDKPLVAEAREALAKLPKPTTTRAAGKAP